MRILRVILVILAGLLSAPLTDLLGIYWMGLAPADLDLTGSYYLSVVIPTVLFLHLLMAVVLWKLFAREPTRNPVIYVATHVIAQAGMLNAFGNPTADIATYATIVLLSGGAVMGLFRYYLWCPHCALAE
ncbi:MAG: hypothetical protein R3E82_14025 [Pseudomonadales bacterium]|nr:hypothetical protein [Pseudomonadales bacterium]